MHALLGHDCLDQIGGSDVERWVARHESSRYLCPISFLDRDRGAVGAVGSMVEVGATITNGIP